MDHLSYLDSLVLGIVEGLTEFLPVSSTGHLTITEKLLGLNVDDKAVTAYTAIIQMGAIVATLIYFAKDIIRLLSAWVRGLRDSRQRSDHDYKLAWAVIVGSLPVGVVGFLFKDLITGALRSLWVVALALILWSVVMFVAEVRNKELARLGYHRGEGSITLRDGVIIGLVQCFALIPGISRSGATISGGLLRGIDRVTATRLSFFMAIPALTAAGLFELKDVDPKVVGGGQLLLGIVVSFVVAYASIAWLLKFVAGHRITVFVWYRVGLGLLLMVALAAGLISAT